MRHLIIASEILGIILIAVGIAAFHPFLALIFVGIILVLLGQHSLRGRNASD